VQTNAVAEWLTAARAGLPPVTVIPNPVPHLSYAQPPLTHGARAYLFAAGRLIHSKASMCLSEHWLCSGARAWTSTW